jgi:hypothetical protein
MMLEDDLSQLDEPRQMVPNLYSQKHNRDLLEPVQGAVYVFHVPVPTGGESPWFQYARGLSDFRRDGKNTSMPWMMQYVLGLPEAPVGTPSFGTVSRDGHEAKLFSSLIHSYARDMVGLSEPKERELLKQYCRWTKYYDPAMSQLITIAMATAKAGKTSGKRDRPGASQGGDAAARLEDEARMAEAARILAYVRTFNSGLNSSYGDLDAPEVLRSLAWPFGPVGQMLENPPVVPQANEGGQVAPAAPADEDVEGGRQFAEAMRAPSDSVPRFVVDVFSMPSARDVSGGRHYMYRVAVLDPLVNLNRYHCWMDDLVGKRNAAAGKARGGVGSRTPYVDEFAHMSRFRNCHPFFTFSMSTYITHASWFLNRRLEPAEEKTRRHAASGTMFLPTTSCFMPQNFLTLERCVQVLEMCGADTSAISDPNVMFQNDPVNIGLTTLLPGRIGDGAARQGEVDALFEPMEEEDAPRRQAPGRADDPSQTHSYRLDPAQCFWSHSDMLGLSQIYFPDYTLNTDYARLLLANRGDPEVTSALLQLQGRSEEERSAPLGQRPREPESRLATFFDAMSESPVIRVTDLPRSLLTYKTGNIIMHHYAERKAAELYVNELLPLNPHREPEKYALYCKVRERFCHSNTEKFNAFWITNGSTDDLPIPGTLKVVLKWFRERNFTTMTRPLMYIDPDMSLWGNYMIKLITSFRQIGTVVQPMIPLMAMALQSTVDHRRGKLKFHMALLGGPDVGKTFPLIDMVRNYIMIPGTYAEQHRATRRADNTDTHTYDTVVLCDEPPEFMFDPRAEKKDYDAVQAFKQVIQSGQQSLKLFCLVTVNGKEMRSSRMVVTDNTATNGYCSNQTAEHNSAIGTRVVQKTVTRPPISTEKMTFDPGASAAQDFAIYLHTQQYLVYKVFKAIQVGAIPDIDPWLFQEVSKLMVGILRDQNLIDLNRGMRPLEIMMALLRYKVVCRAIVAVHDVPGGPMYKKPLDESNVAVYGPYLTTTLEMVLECWHWMHEEYIQDDAGNVMRAWMKQVGYDPHKTAYQNYVTDAKGTIPFQRYPASSGPPTAGAAAPAAASGQGPAGAGDMGAEMINLNFLEFSGSISDLAKKLYPDTAPLMTQDGVEAVLKSLLTRSIKLPRGRKYRPVLQSYLFANHRNQVGREEDMMEPCVNMEAAQVQAMRPHLKVRICPLFLDFLNVDAIKSAFYQCTMCGTFPIQKTMTGLVMEQEPDIFMVENWTQAWRDEYVRLLDNLAPHAPVKRRDGVAIDQMSALTSTERTLLFGQSMDPRRTDHKLVYKNVIDARIHNLYVVRDWDLEAAEKQYLACGLPLDQSKTHARTDAFIRRAYDEYLLVHPGDAPAPETLTNYPEDLLFERNYRNQIHEQNREFYKHATVIQERLSTLGLSSTPNYLHDISLARQGRNIPLRLTAEPYEEEEEARPTDKRARTHVMVPEAPAVSRSTNIAYE